MLADAVFSHKSRAGAGGFVTQSSAHLTRCTSLAMCELGVVVCQSFSPVSVLLQLSATTEPHIVPIDGLADSWLALLR